jgi:hypothetical protein
MSTRFSIACLARIRQKKNPWRSPLARAEKPPRQMLKTKGAQASLKQKAPGPEPRRLLFLPLLIFPYAKISCGGGKPIHAKPENQTAKPENQSLQNEKAKLREIKKTKTLEATRRRRHLGWAPTPVTRRAERSALPLYPP